MTRAAAPICSAEASCTASGSFRRYCTRNCAARLATAADPQCASCHDRIDPLGIPLEGFDALGHARDAYRDATPVSTASELASGAPVDGLLDLASALREDPTVRRCIVERFAAWAIERPITSDDTCLIDTLAGDPSTPISLHDLARAIANQPALSAVVAP